MEWSPSRARLARPILFLQAVPFRHFFRSGVASMARPEPRIAQRAGQCVRILFHSCKWKHENTLSTCVTDAGRPLASVFNFLADIMSSSLNKCVLDTETIFSDGNADPRWHCWSRIFVHGFRVCGDRGCFRSATGLHGSWPSARSNRDEVHGTGTLLDRREVLSGHLAQAIPRDPQPCTWHCSCPA
jgi:hypothetical protein